jgi:hypothetical protein
MSVDQAALQAEKSGKSVSQKRSQLPQKDPEIRRSNVICGML